MLSVYSAATSKVMLGVPIVSMCNIVPPLPQGVIRSHSHTGETGKLGQEGTHWLLGICVREIASFTGIHIVCPQPNKPLSIHVIKILHYVLYD